MNTSFTLPTAYSVAPSPDFLDHDGTWSTFRISIGSGTGAQGSQAFKAIVSTSSFDILVPEPVACSNTTYVANGQYFPAFPANCPVSRGVGLFNGVQSSGYQSNDSATAPTSSYGAEGLQLGTLGSPSNLFGPTYAENASVYSDTVSFDPLASGGSAISSSGVVPIDGYDQTGYLLPYLGIGFGVHQIAQGAGRNINSTLNGLALNGSIPGQSWGYTAGAFYDSKRPASLTLGGYDSARISGTPLRSNMTAGNQLVVAVSQVAIRYKNGSSPASSPTGAASSFKATIDSTLPYLYLPNETITWLAQTLHLSEYGALFYLSSSQLEANNTRINVDSFQFTIGQGVASATSANDQSLPLVINLPYIAVEALTSWTYKLKTQSYMLPIRRMPTGATTAVLGRAFLQEAYVSADFDRQYFNLSQAAPGPFSGTNIVNVYSPAMLQRYAAGQTSGDTGLSAGAIAGIVVGSVIGGLLVLALIAWFCFIGPRKRRNEQKRKDEEAEAARQREAEKAAEAERLAKSPELDGYDRSGRNSMMSDYTLVSGMGVTSRPSQRRRFSELSSDSETEGAQPKYNNTLIPVAELEHRPDPVELEGHRPPLMELPSAEASPYTPNTPHYPYTPRTP